MPYTPPSLPAEVVRLLDEIELRRGHHPAAVDAIVERVLHPAPAPPFVTPLPGLTVSVQDLGYPSLAAYRAANPPLNLPSVEPVSRETLREHVASIGRAVANVVEAFKVLVGELAAAAKAFWTALCAWRDSVRRGGSAKATRSASSAGLAQRTSPGRANGLGRRTPTSLRQRKPGPVTRR